jgi:hypothetical protein
MPQRDTGGGAGLPLLVPLITSAALSSSPQAEVEQQD